MGKIKAMYTKGDQQRVGFRMARLTARVPEHLERQRTKVRNLLLICVPSRTCVDVCPPKRDVEPRNTASSSLCNLEVSPHGQGDERVHNRDDEGGCQKWNVVKYDAFE